jgi:sugar lactone lactonase YvrE
MKVEQFHKMIDMFNKLKIAVVFGAITMIAACGGGNDALTPPPPPSVLIPKNVTTLVNATAGLISPSDVAVDANGTVYVADSSNNRIVKITAAGEFSILAGSGSPGSADGVAANASFNTPSGIAVDANGDIYVADSANDNIRKITPAGVVTTLAGAGPDVVANRSGWIDGAALDARFRYPSSVAVDLNGNVFVSDIDNNRIRKITPGGIVSTLAGQDSIGYTDGTGSAASFGSIWDIAVDSSGNVYAAEYRYNLIRKITPAGVVTTLAGSGSRASVDGTGPAASFDKPIGVAVDAGGNVFVSENSGNKIRMITAAGVVTTLAGADASTPGMPIDGVGSVATFYQPYGLSISNSGNLYVADSGNNAIRKISP